ncbi:MAG: homoserine dehydrogenase [Clostridium sp.]|jgi:homoserine dehydrogenase|nr:homoserine dehydrogenase [Clostridium sp.]
MINIAVLGYGTVGSGVVEVIEKNKEMVNKKAGEELYIKYILDIREFPGDPYEDKVVHDVDLILEDREVAVVCETMGGVGAAYQFTKRALENGKSVCTSNKELVAAHGPELLGIARAKHCNYLFEASVGGGIPIIRPLNYSLTAERIEAITGILNGTTNYILTKMGKEGAEFEEVLKEAQEKGYAERNPQADIEGHDACRKIAILSSLMLGKNVPPGKVYTEGITKLEPADFLYAKAAGKTIKLLAMSRMVAPKESDVTAVLVAPFLIGEGHPLSMVNNVFNAVFVRGNMLGDSMYYGQGAGKLPTASAVVSDVIDCARHQGKSMMCFWEKEEAQLLEIGETQRSFFVRGKAGTLEQVKTSFPGGQLLEIPGRREDFGYFTETMKEKDFTAKCKTLGGLILSRLRVMPT